MARAFPVLIVAIPLLAGCLQGATTPLEEADKRDLPVVLPNIEDPGPYNVARLEYDFGPVPLVFQDSRGVPYPTRAEGSVHFPEAGAGPFPVIVFMHGRHGTCRFASTLEFFEPYVCPDTPATANVRSYTGYDYLSAPLASHGYVVISIDANNLNDLDLSMGDQGAVGRAQLISHTLDEFAKLNASAGPAPIAGKLVGRLDFSRIGLMGHSRGGEGVTRFISWNAERTNGPRYALSAVFALAPTDFARWKVTNVVHAALLPYCDGDVSNLQGAWMYDDARYLEESRPSPKIQILAMGSNHNNYNTIWTGDDGGRYNQDPHCGPTNPQTSEVGRRLSPDDQRRHGRVYMEAFFRHYVGGEPEWAPLFTGAAPPPPAACPEGRTTCTDVVHVSYHAPEGRRLVIEDTLESAVPSRNDAGGASAFTGFSATATCASPSCPPSGKNYAVANLLRLTWDAPATWRLTLPAEKGDLTGFDVVSFRVEVDYSDARNKGLTSQDLRAVLTDTAGARASLQASDHSSALFVPPGNDPARRTVPNEVRIPLSAFAGVDLSHVASLELAFDVRASGALLVTDVLAQDEP